MSAEVFPMDAILEFCRKRPHARVHHLVDAIKKKNLHDEMWVWWMQEQLERIIEHECRAVQETVH